MEKAPVAVATPAFKELVSEAHINWQQFKSEVKKVVIGQEHIVEFIIIGLLCDGHILLEGVPGVAKTTMIKTVASIMGLDFKRIQFTPDLLPSDLVGTLVYNQKTGDFETKKGPVFANLILADEINRAPAKVQSALLEAMEERQVTLGSESFQLDAPFLVFATQNPIEQEGTYRLPEAQMDRFMFKLRVGYPTAQEEKTILSTWFKEKNLTKLLKKENIFESRKLVEQVYIDELVTDYIVKIVDATRNPANYGLADLANFIVHGASPRATIALHHACRAYAFLKNRHFVTPDDVKAVCPAILNHRIIVSFEADTENISSETIVQKILDNVATP